MKLARWIILFACLSLTVACGDDGGVNDTPDANQGVDAPPNNIPCMLEGDLGTIAAAQNPRAFGFGPDANNPDVIDVGAPYNQLGFETDWFVFRMFRGEGYFPTTIQPGTFEITGPETDYNTCSACVFLVGDHSGDTAEEEFNTFMATSGTVVVDSVTPTFSATLTNGSFRHIAFNGNTQVPHESGCTATVSSVSISANLTQLPLTALGVEVIPDAPSFEWLDLDAIELE